MPGVEIVNHGKAVFEVYKDNRLHSAFDSYERPDGTVTEEFAFRRATKWFDRVCETGEFKRVQIPDDLDHTDILNSAEKATSRQIDALMAQEKAETDPNRKSQLRKRLLQMMAQEESLAESVVSHLLEER
jgi:hypothetical protein